MSIDPAWEKVHAERPWGRWPNEHFVRFVAKHFPKPGARFVELGCGAGAQLHFLASEGHQVVGVDASEAAIERARKRCALDCEVSTLVADVADLHRNAFDKVDCVLDVACLQHLSATQARKVVNLAKWWLKPGGRVFSLMAAIPTNVTPYKVRVIDYKAMVKLFAGWEIETGHETFRRDDGSQTAHWVIDATPQR